MQEAQSRFHSVKPGYTLVIAEKPDAGRRIAYALGEAKQLKTGNVEVHDVQSSFNGTHYVICSASGHLYTVHDPQNKRSIYPVFEVKWLPISAILAKKNKPRYSKSAVNYGALSRITSRIETIRQLSLHAACFIHACDSDLEGETIGFNILRYTCGLTNWDACKRATFSTITESEIRNSFSHLEPIKESVAEAGCTRHVVDFLWGINLSRALSGAYSKSGHGYHNITIGRVQGPTISFVAKREIEVRTHVPMPYWKIRASLLRKGERFEATYERHKIHVKAEADAIMGVVSREGNAQVKSTKSRMVFRQPPAPFNLSDLQAESYRLHGFSPSNTLRISEKLYLRALISYPRTNSQKLPASIDYNRIFKSIGSIQEYKSLIEYLAQTRRNVPKQGQKDDAAHPAIYPTGEHPRNLKAEEARIYDLIVRRFLATFTQDAMISEMTTNFLLGSYIFGSNDLNVVRDGWMRIYPTRLQKGSSFSTLNEGDILDISKVEMEDHFECPPDRFTESSLLREMEYADLGTKATRADIIATLMERGYMTRGKDGHLEASEIGSQLTDTMNTHCKEIISVDLTRRIESEIEQVAEGKLRQSQVVDHTTSAVSFAVEKIRETESDIGAELAEAIAASRREIASIGSCPQCSNGTLMIMKSSKTGKRFIGCSGYSNGCKASAPLPQRGMIRAQTRTCTSCKWPMITVLFGVRRRPWVICPNMRCPERKQQ